MKTISHLFGRRWQKTIAALFMLGIALGTLPPEVKAQTTTVNILSPGSNPYVIAPGSGDYIIQGFGTQTANRINVQSGYEGTITLDNVKILSPVHYAPIRIFGQYDGDNENPVTKVNLILKGDNNLDSGGNGTQSVAAALQVHQGAQISISAIDPANNASGNLYARTRYNQDNVAGAAGIGGPCVRNLSGNYADYCDGGPDGIYTGNYMYQGTQLKASNYKGYDRATSGGNILISSGTIHAQGGSCGAGIGGGGWGALYLGNIVITGGDITAIGGTHSPGIGGGCVDGEANNGSYAPNSCVIAVPPAKITAYDAYGKKGLSGANYIVYIGDPQSPQFTVYTEDYRATTMYLDLSGDPDVKRKLNQFAPTR
ncbi:MAG: hypothetical protein LBK22_05320, partial [Tannerella sp.]|nr:hypothetical protein [Tannerella sp.]